MTPHSSPNSPKLFSFFAGAGFLDLGFETTGFEVVFANEFSPSFANAYKYSREKMGLNLPEAGIHVCSAESFLPKGNLEPSFAIQLNKTKESSALTGFVAGPPCPDFSIGGKNEGSTGSHGRLSDTYTELVCSHQPDFFLFENVKGLWRTSKHREFYDSIRKRVHKAGYITTDRLINAIEYGVPQDRERIILIGFHKRLFESADRAKLRINSRNIDKLFPWAQHTRDNKDDIFSKPWPSVNPYKRDTVLPAPEGIDQTLTVEHWFTKNEVLDHANAMHVFKPRAALVRFQTIDEGDDSKKSFKRLHRWRYSPTCAYGNNEVHIHPYKPRRITVAEALSLQSLPKQYCLPDNMSLTDMFKVVGNGVPYLAAKGLAESIKDFLDTVLTRRDDV
jgi:DNA (cytosine-5)-methyltransferase 1